MALSFPASPSNGDVYTNTTTGVKYIYNNADGVWKTQVFPTNTDYLQLTGGTLTGNLSLGTNDLTAQDINSTTLTTTGAVTAGNGLTVSAGNVVMSSGAGIDFSATADGSGTMSNELFDDYEEGTWTPAPDQGTATTAEGKYIKFGRLCTITAYVTGLSDRTSGEPFALGGLPFTPEASNEVVCAVMTRYTNNASGSTALYSPVGYMSAGEQRLRIYQQSAQGDNNYDTLKHEDIHNTVASFRYTMTYITT